MRIKAVTDRERKWVRSFLCKRWGAPEVVTRGRIHHADQLPGFIAFESGQSIGLITYALQNKDCEIMYLDSLEAGKGIGLALVKAVADLVSAEGYRRIWLITTNDNTDALRFYQKIGFKLVAIHRDAIKESRKLKPRIPEIGNHGIPIKDEIELELRTP